MQSWSVLDSLYYHMSTLEYVDKPAQNIFRVKPLTYRGRALFLSDGNTFCKHDQVMKIHLHNCVLLKELMPIDNDIKRALYVYNRVEQSLPGLAQYVARHPLEAEIKGIIGITLLNRGVKKLGFEVHEIPNPWYLRLKQLYLKPMFILCHPHPKDAFRGKDLAPKYLIMSKERLLKLYLR